MLERLHFIIGGCVASGTQGCKRFCSVLILLLCVRVALKVVKLRVVATDCGHPPLSTYLDLSLIVNHTDDDYADHVSSWNDDEATPGGGDWRQRSAHSDPANVVLVGAACGSGLVMFTAVLTAVVFALRGRRGRRRHHEHRHDGCCCCCCESGDGG